VPDWNAVSEHVTGTKAAPTSTNTDTGEISGASAPRSEGPIPAEHDDLFAAIRNNTEFNEAYMAPTAP
jgi:hypothetical protein